MGRLRKHPPGYPTSFKNPTTGKRESGEIVEEVWLRDPDDFEEIAPEKHGWRQAAFVAQRLRDRKGHDTARITYYVRSTGEGPDSWRYGGQYAATMEEEEFEALFEKLVDAGWFARHPST